MKDTLTAQSCDWTGAAKAHKAHTFDTHPVSDPQPNRTAMALKKGYKNSTHDHPKHRLVNHTRAMRPRQKAEVLEMGQKKDFGNMGKAHVAALIIRVIIIAVVGLKCGRR